MKNFEEGNLVVVHTFKDKWSPEYVGIVKAIKRQAITIENKKGGSITTVHRDYIKKSFDIADITLVELVEEFMIRAERMQEFIDELTDIQVTKN